ncbi:hypothetical protein HY485_04240 [Candidatus Woesearchaeota archaeon]|nr:hypothetical protein [Candidatus Woesearchaeota archaeon]
MGRQLDYLVNCVYQGTPLEVLAEGYKPFDIENTRDTIFHLLAKNCAGKPSLKLAKTLREFKCCRESSAEFLKKFIKQGQTISEEELQKYALRKDVQLGLAYPEVCWPDGRDVDFSYAFGDGVFYDAKFNFCLTYTGELAAFAGFVPEEHKLFVKQIQGVKQHKNKKFPLHEIKWTAGLLSLIVKFAQENKIPEVEVQSVENNKWARMTFKKFKENGLYRPSTTLQEATSMSAEEEQELKKRAIKLPNICYTDIHLMPRQGFLIYNVTAKRLGFENAENGNYVLKTA